MTTTSPTIGQLTAHNLVVDITPTPRPSVAALGTFTGLAACSCRGWSSGSVSSNDRQWVDDTIRADHARHVARVSHPGHDYRLTMTGSGELHSAWTSCSCGGWFGAYTADEPAPAAARAAAGHAEHIDAVRAALPAWAHTWAAVVDRDGVVTTTRPELADRLRAAGLTVVVIGQ